MKVSLTTLLTTIALSFNAVAADSKPVSVVNTPTVEVVNEVPVTIENVPLVEVANEVPVTIENVPLVEVANEVPVTIENIPLVEIAHEVPVTVENIPRVEVINSVTVAAPVLQPAMFSHFGQFGPSEQFLIHRFQVEAGKTLLVEQISNVCSSFGALGSLVIGRTAVPGRRYPGLRLSFEETNLTTFRDHAYSTHAVTYYVQGGDELEVAINAQDADEGVCTIGVIGRYIEAAQ